VTLTSTSGPTVLFDETKSPSDADVFGFLPKPTSAFQQANVMRGPSPFMAYRYNLWTQLDWTIDHRFATYALAMAFAGARPYIPRVGELLIAETTTEGVTSGYYKVAYLTAIVPVTDQGLRRRYKYTVLTPSVYSNSP